MARAYVEILFDGFPIRKFGGNNSEVRRMIFLYQTHPEKLHPWMVGAKDVIKRLAFRTEFNR